MRKIIVVVVMLCLLLAGCGGNTLPNTDTTESDAAGNEPQASGVPGTVALTDGEGKAVYRIVRPDECSGIVTNAAITLRTKLKEATGADFELKSDFLNKLKNETADGICEILVGATNRAESGDAASGLGIFDYVITVSGVKIVIAGGSEYAVSKAVDEFCTLLAAGKAPEMVADLKLIGSAEAGEYLLGVTNQGESCIEVYDISAGVLNASTRIWRVSMPYYNIAGLKLREHYTYGKVAISTCGSNYASMITYPEGKTVWSTNVAANNPHSIELIPEDIIVVASSTGAALRFFDIGKNTGKYTEVAFDDAHGVLWDPENQLLWALGRNVLTAFKITKSADGKIEATEVTERRSTVPTDYGHDLSPVYGDKNQLWVTTSSGNYRYDKTTKTFTNVFEGSNVIVKSNVKSLGNFADGSLMLTVPDRKFQSWTTATVNIYFKSGSSFSAVNAKSATGNFYKCRVWCADYQ